MTREKKKLKVSVNLKTKKGLKYKFICWQKDHQSLIMNFHKRYKQVPTNFLTGEKSHVG
jgi:hypothetical protein